MNTHTKSGLLTNYGLSCGYVQTAEKKDNKKELYKEHGIYHVRTFVNGKRILWQSFDKLSEARNVFNNTTI